MHSALLADALVGGVVEVEHLEGIVIPIEHAGHADDPIDIDPIIRNVQLL